MIDQKGIITITPRTELSPEQIDIVSARIDAVEHTFDNGACKSWHDVTLYPHLYVAQVAKPSHWVGVLYADGQPNEISASWWLDSKFRGQGLGSEMVDAFAAYLKKYKNVTGVGDIRVDTFKGEYHAQSSALAVRFKNHFH